MSAEDTNAMLTREILSINKNYVDINLKLEILVNSREHENKAGEAFRARMESDRTRMQSEITVIKKELSEVQTEQAVRGVTFNDFNTVKNSIIKWVIGSLLGFTSIGAALITYLPKG